MRTIEIAVLLGSGRRQGNSEAAVEAILSGLSIPGDEVERFYLNEMNVGHCQACEACRENGGICVQTDNMDIIYDVLGSADLVLIATPIYFSGPSSLLKQVIDRCQCLWARNSPMPEDRWAALVTVSGQKGANFRNTQSIVRSFVNSVPLQWAGEFQLPGFDEEEALESDPATLAKAELFGRELSEKIR